MRVYLGLGSNVQPNLFLPRGIEELQRLLGPLLLSPVYEGAAMGFAGDRFWNLVVRVDTTLSVGALQGAIREIEFAHGRPLHTTRISPRSLDIDILTCDAFVGTVDGVELPRGEILHHAFVLRPLADLAPDVFHPVQDITYAELWAAFDQISQPLERVTLELLS